MLYLLVCPFRYTGAGQGGSPVDKGTFRELKGRRYPGAVGQQGEAAWESGHSDGRFRPGGEL